LIILSGLAFIQFSPQYAFIERWIIILGALVIYLVPQSTWTEVIYIGVAFGLALVYALGYRIVSTSGKFPPYKWSNVGWGLGFTAFAVLFFVLSNVIDTNTYWLWHSLWHTCAAIGQFFILQIWPLDEKAKWAAMDSQIQVPTTIKRHHGLMVYFNGLFCIPRTASEYP
jgi:hypothetical protein